MVYLWERIQVNQGNRMMINNGCGQRLLKMAILCWINLPPQNPQIIQEWRELA